MIFCCYNYYIYMFLFFGKEVMNNGGGGGATRNIYWWGVYITKGAGGLRCGHNQKHEGPMCGYFPKMGGFGTGFEKREGLKN